jgi:hypothetical protein
LSGQEDIHVQLYAGAEKRDWSSKKRFNFNKILLFRLCLDQNNIGIVILFKIRTHENLPFTF